MPNKQTFTLDHVQLYLLTHALPDTDADSVLSLHQLLSSDATAVLPTLPDVDPDYLRSVANMYAPEGAAFVMR